VGITTLCPYSFINTLSWVKLLFFKKIGLGSYFGKLKYFEIREVPRYFVLQKKASSTKDGMITRTQCFGWSTNLPIKQYSDKKKDFHNNPGKHT
jgi:hypothetical protein